MEEALKENGVTNAIGLIGFLSSIVTIASIFTKESPILVGILTLLTVALGSLWLYQRSITKYIGYNPKDSSELIRIAASMLQSSSESLHYFGAMALMNDEGNQSWNLALKKKLKEEDFTVCRYIHLLTPEDIEQMFKNDLRARDHYIQGYEKWLQLHSERSRWSDARHENRLVNLKCAPIWQHGLHYLIFDRKHVLFVYRKDNHVRGILMRNRAKFAAHQIEMFSTLEKHYGAGAMRQPDLETLHKQIKAYMEEHHIAIGDGDLPSAATFPAQLAEATAS